MVYQNVCLRTACNQCATNVFQYFLLCLCANSNIKNLYVYSNSNGGAALIANYDLITTNRYDLLLLRVESVLMRYLVYSTLSLCIVRYSIQLLLEDVSLNFNRHCALPCLLNFIKMFYIYLRIILWLDTRFKLYALVILCLLFVLFNSITVSYTIVDNFRNGFI